MLSSKGSSCSSSLLVGKWFDALDVLTEDAIHGGLHLEEEVRRQVGEGEGQALLGLEVGEQLALDVEVDVEGEELSRLMGCRSPSGSSRPCRASRPSCG